MSRAIKFASIGRGFHEHRCPRWLLRIEPVEAASYRDDRSYLAVINQRGAEPATHGPFRTVTAAKAHLSDLVQQQEAAR